MKREILFVVCWFLLLLNLLKLGETTQSVLETNLETAITELNRLSLLQDRQFIFDFENSTVGISSGTGGRTISANAATFPALIGHGVSMTIGDIGPCGINLPHIHPRATEINFVAEGKFQAGFFSENGGKLILNNLTQGQAIVFPQGVIHFEQNLNCRPAKFVAAFNHQDPGVSTIATNLFQLPTNILLASLGPALDQRTLQNIIKSLPKNPALGIAECKRRCGLKK